MAVRQGKFQRFGQGVNVSHGIVPQCAQVEAAHQIQSLQQHRALTPEPAGADFLVAKANAFRRLDGNLEFRQILASEQSAVVAVVGYNFFRNLTAIKGIVHRLQALLAAPSRSRFHVRQVLQGAAQVCLHEQISRFRRSTARQVDRRVGRPAPVKRLVTANLGGGVRMNGETVLGEPYGGPGHFAEGHRPELP